MTDAPHIDYFNLGPWPIFVGFTMSPEAFAKEMERIGLQDAPTFISNSHSHATTHLFDNDDALTLAIITLSGIKGRSKEQVAGLIAHEAVHVGQYLWERIGEREPGREAEAYLVQQITQECLQIIWNTGRTRSIEPKGIAA